MKKIILLLTLSLTVLLVRAAGPFAIISGEIRELNDSDIVTLTTDIYGDPGFTGFSAEQVQQIKNHRFIFKIPAGKVPVRFSLRFRNKTNSLLDFNRYAQLALAGYYALAGDTLRIWKEGTDLAFAGNHARHYRIHQQMKQKIRQALAVSPTGPENMLQQFQQKDQLALALLEFLDHNKAKLNEGLYTLYRSEAITEYFGKGNLLYMMTDSMRKIAVSTLTAYTSPDVLDLVTLKQFNKETVLRYADHYSKSLYWQYQLDSCYRVFRSFSLPAYCRYINGHYTGLLRERLITNILYERRTDPIDMTVLLAEALPSTTNGDFRKILGQLQSQRVPGAIAYDFKLVDAKGKLHRLSDYKGKTVLLDFWYTGCGNCIRVQPYLRKIASKMQSSPVVFLSVNVDKSREQWLKSVATGTYTGPEVINLYTGGLQIQHPVCKIFAIDAYPTFILVDPEGRLMRNPEDPRKDEGKDLEQLITSNF